jgi:hypothetical protein
MHELGGWVLKGMSGMKQNGQLSVASSPSKNKTGRASYRWPVGVDLDVEARVVRGAAPSISTRANKRQWGKDSH